LIWLLVTHESTRTFTPHRLHDAGNFLSKREPPKSRSNRHIPGGMRVQQDSAAHVSLSSIFSCQRSDITDAISWACCFWLGPGRVSLTRLSWISQGRTFLSPAARRPRCGAYIVGAHFRCQHRSRSFFEIFATAFFEPRFAVWAALGAMSNPFRRHHISPQRSYVLTWGQPTARSMINPVRPRHKGALLRPHCRLMN
jgi:hypothetical protein